MTTFGVRLVSGSDAGIAPHKADGRYAEAVIELSEVAGTVPSLVAGTSGAAATIGLGKSKGCLHRGYDADILVVGGEPAADVKCPAGCAASRASGYAGAAAVGARRTTHHGGVTADETLGSSGR
jgi:imidazolonepropionase-like amidohydrolase